MYITKNLTMERLYAHYSSMYLGYKFAHEQFNVSINQLKTVFIADRSLVND